MIDSWAVWYSDRTGEVGFEASGLKISFAGKILRGKREDLCTRIAGEALLSIERATGGTGKGGSGVIVDEAKFSCASFTTS